MVSAALPWLQAPLARTLASARAHHALLVQGPAGVGQLAFALELARAWLCEHPGGARGGPACGQCRSCHLVDERSHPDLRLIVPEAQRAEAGLPAETLGEWPLRLEFESWVARMNTPFLAITQIRALIDGAPREVRASLAIAEGYSFSVPTALLRGRRAP